MLHEVGGEGGAGGAGGGNQHQDEEWDAAAKQLYNAIMILITAWNLRPGPIYNYLEEARRYRRCVPYSYRVDRINQNSTSTWNIIKRCFKSAGTK